MIAQFPAPKNSANNLSLPSVNKVKHSDQQHFPINAITEVQVCLSTLHLSPLTLI